MRWLALLLVTGYFLWIRMGLLHLLVLCDLYLSFLLMVFLLAPWRLVIGRRGFLILVGWNILEVKVYIGCFLIWVRLISGFNIII
jgi:hypothetical protein